jgi:hypothetical protein
MFLKKQTNSNTIMEKNEKRKYYTIILKEKNRVQKRSNKQKPQNKKNHI